MWMQRLSFPLDFPEQHAFLLGPFLHSTHVMKCMACAVIFLASSECLGWGLDPKMAKGKRQKEFGPLRTSWKSQEKALGFPQHGSAGFTGRPTCFYCDRANQSSRNWHTSHPFFLTIWLLHRGEENGLCVTFANTQTGALISFRVSVCQCCPDGFLRIFSLVISFWFWCLDNASKRTSNKNVTNITTCY